jgi:hypothetical protein
MLSGNHEPTILAFPFIHHYFRVFTNHANHVISAIDSESFPDRENFPVALLYRRLQQHLRRSPASSAPGHDATDL